MNTTLGNKPYVRVYVNIDEILSAAGKYILERAPEITVFEGAATSDPLPVERYTGSLTRDSFQSWLESKVYHSYP
ncbi:MAG: hypothetical protein VR69_11990 [Peptococcaceae bacterium BRH_c4b]|nr:MAG: hypothetical protein VR69_11990 [Peptococcaceae bacterium BRH_c4b]